MEPPSVLILFVLGVVTDFIWSLALKANRERAAARASVCNMILASLSFGSLWSVVSHNSLPEAISYIVGCGVGTYFSIRK